MNKLPRSSQWRSLVTGKQLDLGTFPMLDLIGVDGPEKLGAAMRNALEKGYREPGELVRDASVPPGETEGYVYKSAPRGGVVAHAMQGPEGLALTGGSLFFSDGKQHQFELEAMTLGQAGEYAVLHGFVDELQVSLFDPLHLENRHWHGPGSRHEMLVYGIAIEVDRVGRQQSVVDPAGIEVNIGGSGFASILPLDEDASFPLYAITGPVVEAQPCSLEIEGCRFTRLVVTCAYLLSDMEELAFDIVVFIPDIVDGAKTDMKVGDAFSGSVFLCGHMWMANDD